MNSKTAHSNTLRVVLGAIGISLFIAWAVSLVYIAGSLFGA